ncbi:MAG TPA: FGGY-family carbohydrate kinase [Symbiobacteriaceae bacterium]|nr:FGGY-family carbohydrate kinase [Symbiobacteriaceae bacterium]
MAPSYLIGIDGGTESIRVGVFDLQGRLVGMAARAYPLYHPKAGWAEQHPADWWSSLTKASREAMATARVQPGDIAGISLDATSCSVVFADRQGNPLRPSIIWMDVRASAQAARLSRSTSPALAYTGSGSVSAEWMPSKALWVKEHEPEVWARSEVVCEYLDWLTFRLTGRWTASLMNTSCRWFYNRRQGGWPRDLYQEVGLLDALEKFPPEVLPLGDHVGPLTAEAAADLGLLPGTPVMEGGVDAFAAMPALQVTKPGRMALIMGSSYCELTLADAPTQGRGMFGGFPDAVVPGYWMVEGGQTSTGSVVKWFRDQFAMEDRLVAESRGMETYDVLSEAAAKIPPGSDGLLVLEHWQGGRTPNTDSRVRGAVMGLSLRHTRAHVYRAIVEATAYGAEYILRTFAGNGVPVDSIVACGGPTKSPFWMQIQADVCGRPILIPEVTQAPALGSAIAAAVGAGIYRDFHDASEQMVHISRCIEPNMERHHLYKPYVDAYIEAFERLRPVHHRLSDLQT